VRALEDADGVYLTWRKGADGTSRIAVAIEFLPKPPWPDLGLTLV
jgi:hypothetical protein